MEREALPEIIELTPPPDPARSAGGGRLPLLLAATALVVSLAALGLAYVDRAAPAPCSSAWDAAPAKLPLPPGWTTSGEWYSQQSASVALTGGGVTTREGSAWVNWNCYGDGSRAARFLALTRAAADGTASELTDFPKIGDETLALESTDSSNRGAFDIYWRRSDLVTSLQGAPGVTLSDMEALATAVDAASRR